MDIGTRKPKSSCLSYRGQKWKAIMEFK